VVEARINNEETIEVMYIAVMAMYDKLTIKLWKDEGNPISIICASLSYPPGRITPEKG